MAPEPCLPEGDRRAAGHLVGVTERAALEARYRSLVREQLPAAARAQRWVLRDDHCFGRVLLDDTVGACWYDVLDRRRTAFLQLDDAQLARAVELAERLLVEGDVLLRELDARSLAWRGKPPKQGSAGAATTGARSSASARAGRRTGAP